MVKQQFIAPYILYIFSNAIISSFPLLKFNSLLGFSIVDVCRDTDYEILRRLQQNIRESFFNPIRLPYVISNYNKCRSSGRNKISTSNYKIKITHYIIYLL